MSQSNDQEVESQEDKDERFLKALKEAFEREEEAKERIKQDADNLKSENAFCCRSA